MVGKTYVLNKRSLVLEGVTLARVVKLMVEVLVDLARGTVLDQKTAENAKAAHPQNLPVVVEFVSTRPHTSQGVGGNRASTIVS